MTQDQFLGALDDLSLTIDPLTQNRYALAGGNPIGYVEWDRHRPTDVDGHADQEAVAEMNRSRGVAPPPGTIGSGPSAEFASGDARSVRRVRRSERRTLTSERRHRITVAEQRRNQSLALDIIGAVWVRS